MPLLANLGIDFNIDWGFLTLNSGDWLSNPGVLDLGFVEIRLVNLSLVFAGMWAFTGFGVITITAGLTGIPQELIEAAKVDGATSVQTIRKVLLPMLRGPIGVVAVISFIFALRTFDIVYVMTEGGPAQDTTVLALLLWQRTYVFLDSPQAGAAAAMAVIMSVALIIVCFPYLRRMLGTRGGDGRDECKWDRHPPPFGLVAVRSGDGSRRCCGWCPSSPP